ncbi:MAG: DUF3846 domain-containing protein [Eubacterium sp.]|nr:DUF3846 domain-containing protein [Eubacterium sp.]
MKDKMRVLYLPVNKFAKIIEVDIKSDRLKALQNLVSNRGEKSLIELVSIEQGVFAVVNEEGLINGSTLNRAIYDEYGNMITIAGGNAFLCGDNGYELIDIPSEVVDKYLSKYYYPEIFIRNEEGKILPIKYIPENK